jgi:hypothetical protein
MHSAPIPIGKHTTETSNDGKQAAFLSKLSIFDRVGFHFQQDNLHSNLD